MSTPARQLLDAFLDACLRVEAAPPLDPSKIALTGYYIRLVRCLELENRAAVFQGKLGAAQNKTLFMSLTREALECGVRKATILEWLTGLSQNGIVRFDVSRNGVRVDLTQAIDGVKQSVTQDREMKQAVDPSGPTSRSVGIYPVPAGPNTGSLGTHGPESAFQVRTEGSAPPEPPEQFVLTELVGKEDKSETQVTDEDLAPIYALYPRRSDRGRGYKVLRRHGITRADLPALKQAVENYAASVAGKDREYTRLWTTFVGNWRDWIEVEKKAASIVLVDMDALYASGGDS